MLIFVVVSPPLSTTYPQDTFGMAIPFVFPYKYYKHPPGYFWNGYTICIYLSTTYLPLDTFGMALLFVYHKYYIPPHGFFWDGYIICIPISTT